MRAKQKVRLIVSAAKPNRWPLVSANLPDKPEKL